MTIDNTPHHDVSDVLEFIVQLGRAYLASGEQTYKVEQTLRRTASAYGIEESHIVAFPTAIFLSLYDGSARRSSHGDYKLIGHWRNLPFSILPIIIVLLLNHLVVNLLPPRYNGKIGPFRPTIMRLKIQERHSVPKLRSFQP